MNTIGIIAEYNPFHNGHLYQINRIKEVTGAKNIVVVMSGDFVQRGAPAWTDKYLRTQMALSAGVDFIFELPVSFATASAETFALAGVSLLSSLGFVDGICFGSEYGEIPLLDNIAHFLVQPPESFHRQLKELVSQGFSFPAARQRALTEHFKKECIANPTLLSSPNNILAIEYLKAIRLLGSKLAPYTIKRSDLGYHSENLPDIQPSKNKVESTLASATAIRKESISINKNFLHRVQTALPKNVFHIMEQNTNRFPITENDFSSLLYYRLNSLSDDDISILDMTPELFHRIENCLADFTDFSSFTVKTKTKQYTYSRVSRVLLHTLLNIYNYHDLLQTKSTPALPTKDNLQLNASPLTKMPQNEMFQLLIDNLAPVVPYARLLGFSKEKSALLRSKPSVPIIAKSANGIRQITDFYSSDEKLLKPKDYTTCQSILESNYTFDLSDYISYAHQLYQKDIFAANLYTHVQNTKLNSLLSNEYLQKPVMIP